ncbi:ribonuclease P protein component [Candidatus Saccharibacteria bacterium]|nr:ribonuclease P protein component [Candidatus Saccharibacteria bacterium]
MISKKFRFHGYGSLKYLFQNGEGARSKFFGLRYVENLHRGHPRLTVIVSKKIAKSAVKRNRMRRKVYEILRQHFNFEIPYDIAVTVFSDEVLIASRQELEEQLKKLISELK